MTSKVAVVFFYDKRVKYGINAVVASIDLLEEIDVYLVENKEVLKEVLNHVSNKYKVCVIGFSILTTMLADREYLDFVREITRIARKLKCIPVAGGPHASGDPIGTIYNLGFQIVFIGESEESFRNFIVKLRDGEDFYQVKGLIFKDNDGIVFTGRPGRVDLNKYHPFPFWRHIVNPIEITRGCPFGCKYCQVTYMHGSKMIHRSIDKVIEYARIMVSNGLRDIRFISPNSLAYGSTESGKPNLNILNEFFTQFYEKIIKKYKARIFFGTFPSEVRPEYVNEEIMRILKKYVSNKIIILGAQSGSERVLEFIGRKHSVDDVINAVDIIHRFGFTASVDIILGLPRETIEEMFETINMIKLLVKKGAKIHLHVFMPLPGTPFAYLQPTKIPVQIRREIAKIIGMGKAYGEWIRQEKIAWKIVELREKGIILPRRKI